jgi:hypothetical protein
MLPSNPLDPRCSTLKFLRFVERSTFFSLVQFCEWTKEKRPIQINYMLIKGNNGSFEDELTGICA